MMFDEAIGRFKTFEERAKHRAEQSENVGGQLLLTHVEWKLQHKKDGRGTGRGGTGRGFFHQNHRSGVTNHRTSSDRDKSHIQCFNSSKYGHYASDCRRNQPCDEPCDEANLTSIEEEEEEEELALLLALSVEMKQHPQLHDEPCDEAKSHKH